MIALLVVGCRILGEHKVRPYGRICQQKWIGFRRAAAFGLNLPMYYGIIEPEAYARSREGVDIPAPVERLERCLK